MGLILPDSSIWVAYFRRGPQADVALQDKVDALFAHDERAVAICAPVRMELRFGTDEIARRRIERTLDNLPEVEMDPGRDFDLAGDIYREARRIGRPLLSAIDCVIAALAIRAEAELIHADRDFDQIAHLFPELKARRLA